MSCECSQSQRRSLGGLCSTLVKVSSYHSCVSLGKSKRMKASDFFLLVSHLCIFMCVCPPGVCRSAGLSGAAGLWPECSRPRGGGQSPAPEEDSPDDPAVEDHEQQTVWSVLPEQLRVLHGDLQVRRKRGGKRPKSEIKENSFRGCGQSKHTFGSSWWPVVDFGALSALRQTPASQLIDVRAQVNNQ